MPEVHLLRGVVSLLCLAVFIVSLLCLFAFYWFDVPFDQETRMTPWQKMLERWFFFSVIALLLLLPVFIGMVVSAYSRLILAITSYRGFVVPCLALAVAFYWLRGRWPLFYGLIEVIVGTAATWLSIEADATGLMTRSLGILGGIYIIVRGADNIDRGLPGMYRERWDKVFPKQVRG